MPRGARSSNASTSRHYYSVPHALIHTAVEICLTATTVDVLLRGVRVWLHVRSDVPGRHTTIADHLPKAHRAHLEWSPSRLIGWGATIGRHTEALVQALLESRPHPEQGYRSCPCCFANRQAIDQRGRHDVIAEDVAPVLEAFWSTTAIS